VRPHSACEGSVARSAGPALLALLALAVFFAFAAPAYFRGHPLPLRSELALYGCLVLLIALAIVPAMPAVRAEAARRLSGSGLAGLAAVIWTIPYLIYAAGTGDFRWDGLTRLLAICLPPLLIYGAAPVRNAAVLNWQDGIAWTWLVLVMVLRLWNGIWNVPVSLDFMARLFAIGVAGWSWVLVRPVSGLGYDYRLSVRTLKAAALGFAGFPVVAIPASFAMGFAGWHPRWHGLLSFGTSLVEILVFIAWLEELLFRGFLQTLAARSLRSPAAGRLLASLAFGASHVLLAPAPNWRYVVMASIAGWFYGLAFQRGGNLLAPALAHALVDTAWRTWFLK
jgi:hypothetical protein